MGILEIHFHDSQFEWTVNPGTSEERSLSLGLGSESGGSPTEATAGERGGQSDSSIPPKLKSMAVLALVVGAAAAFNRIQSRRAQKVREGEEESSGGRLSPFLSR